MTVEQTVQAELQLRSAPLEGVRVLDLSRFIAGPLCAQNLGDFGAEVIRLERPGGGDERQYPPLVNGHSLYVMVYNRNKLGITLDTRHPSAGPILRGLIAACDVLVENYRPGTLDKMGIGWQDLHGLSPRTILTSISGWGQTGPNVDRAVFDAIAQAASGLMSQTGPEGMEPMLSGAFVADYMAAAHATIGTLAALLARASTGEGQHVDVALVDSMFCSLGTMPSAYKLFGSIPKRTGNRDAITVPANLYRAVDGYVYIHAGSDPLFPRLANAVGRPELIDDMRFRGHQDRLAHVEEIDAIVAGWVADKTSMEIEETLIRAGVPVARAATVPEVTESRQIEARAMMVNVDHPFASQEVPLPDQPIKLSATPAKIRMPAPDIGEHNDEVYSRLLGLVPSRLDQLRAEHVI
jgi:crotonobetainyl-CoA:carnitine CoA-transferase CaiB-like acyl-CoA transferase